MTPRQAAERAILVGLIFALIHFVANFLLWRWSPTGVLARLLSLPADLLLPLLPINEDGEGLYPSLQLVNSLLWGGVVGTLVWLARRRR